MGVMERLKGVKDQFCELAKQNPALQGIDVDKSIEIRRPMFLSYDKDNRTYSATWIPYHHHHTALGVNITDENSLKIQNELSKFIASKAGYYAMRRAFNPGFEAASRGTAIRLFEIGAVKITDKPPYFDYAAGDYGSYYVDCGTLSTENAVAEGAAVAMAETLTNEVYTNIGCILGGEIRGIVPGKELARVVNKPFFVIRKQAKKRGMRDLIVGNINKLESPALLVEDLARDGGSKITFIDNATSCGIACNVAFAVYDRLEGARERLLKERNCEFYATTDHDAAMKTAIEEGLITSGQLKSVEEYLKDKTKWTAEHPWPDRPKA